MSTEPNADVATLINIVSRGRPWHAGEAALKLGGMKCREAVPALLTRLGHVDFIRALGWIGDDRALQPILDFIDSCDVEFRSAVVDAAIAIGKESSQDVLSYLHNHARSDHPCGREEAIAIIGGLQKPGSLAILTDLLNDTSQIIQMATIKAIGMLGDSRGVRFLVPLLEKSRDYWLACVIISAIGKCGNKESAVHVIPFLKSADSSQRAYAAIALGDLRANHTAVPLVRLVHRELKTNDLPYSPLHVLMKMDEPAVLGELARALPKIHSSKTYETRNTKVDLSRYIIQKASSREVLSQLTSRDLRNLCRLQNWTADFDMEAGPSWSEHLSFDEVRSKAKHELASRSWLRRIWG